VSSFKKAFLFLIFLGLFSIFLLSSARIVEAETADSVRVYGRVMDTEAGLPISNASVVFWNRLKVLVAQTDASGFYSIDLQDKGPYEVYAYRYLPKTSGFDYVPVSKAIYLEKGSYDLPFTLSPGACVNIKGEIRSIRTLQPLWISFTIEHKSGLRTVATILREDSVLMRLLNLGGRLVFVPADTPIKIKVDIYDFDLEYSLSIDQEGDYLNLKRGEMLAADHSRQILLIEVNASYNYASTTQALVEDAGKIGFYVFYERNELEKAENLIDAGALATSREAYDEAYADLREAYLIIKRTKEAIQTMYFNASASTLFITPFLVFTTLAIAALISEKRLQRLVISLSSYGLLLSVLYFLYPGYILLGRDQLLTLSFGSFLAVYFAVHVFPTTLKDKPSEGNISRISGVIMAFSVSAKNLSRRRLRTFLSLTLVLISVFAFIALTSFSDEYGFITRQLGKAGSFEGLIIRKQPTSDLVLSDPIQLETLEWLQERAEITLLSPKIENVPRVSPLGLLVAPTSGSSFQICGVLGIAPSAETRITQIGSIILQGRLLSDDDVNGILISEQIARYMDVGINDTLRLFDQDLTLVGTFDNERYQRLIDLDMTPMVPHKITLSLLGGGEPSLSPCSSAETVIVHQKKAQEFPSMILSRIVVQTGDSGEILPISRQTVMKWTGIEALSFVARQIYWQSIGSYYIASGFLPAMVPLALAALNIGVFMRAIVSERKQELMVISSIGMNPFHITALFMTEALTIGIVAGSLGYITGITSYHFMKLLPWPPMFKHKVEAMWGVLALFAAIVATTLGSALPALKSSTIITPSSQRRWKIDMKPKGINELWILSMPIRIREERLDDFFTFMRDNLRRINLHVLSSFSWFELGKDTRFDKKRDTLAERKLRFTHICNDYGINTENELTATKSMIPQWHVVKLTTLTRRGAITSRAPQVRVTANVIRHLVLQYCAKYKA